MFIEADNGESNVEPGTGRAEFRIDEEGKGRTEKECKEVKGCIVCVSRMKCRLDCQYME